ncbi:hypothetical protein CapIbe_011608 [Capra ibex]
MSSLSRDQAQTLNSPGPVQKLAVTQMGRREDRPTRIIRSRHKDRRARSCSYNQRRPFCVHLRGAWLWAKTPGAVCSSHVLTTRLVPALPPSHLGRVQPGRSLALADPGGGKRPPGRKPP